MSDLVKENIRQTTGGGTTTVDVTDGTAAGNATVQPTITTVPAAGDNPLLVRAMIGDEVELVKVLSGLNTPETANDNSLLVRPAARVAAVVQDGDQVAIGAAADAIVAANNVDRIFLSVKNDSGVTVNMALGAAATATDIEIPNGGSFTMEAANGIYTGAVHIYNPSGGGININVIEF